MERFRANYLSTNGRRGVAIPDSPKSGSRAVVDNQSISAGIDSGSTGSGNGGELTCVDSSADLLSVEKKLDRWRFRRPQQQQTYLVSCLTTCRLSVHSILLAVWPVNSFLLCVNRTRFPKILYPYISVYHISVCVSSWTYICLYLSVFTL